MTTHGRFKTILTHPEKRVKDYRFLKTSIIYKG